MASKFLKVLVPRALGVVDCGEGCEALSKRVLPARTLGILENPFVLPPYLLLKLIMIGAWKPSEIPTSVCCSPLND